MKWYILKVQSNREESIREGLLRRVAIAGLGYYFGEVIVRYQDGGEAKVHFFASRLKYSRWVEVTLVPDERVDRLGPVLARIAQVLHEHAAEQARHG